METRLLLSLLGGVLAFAVSLTAGYAFWSRLRLPAKRRRMKLWNDVVRGPELPQMYAALPLTAGVVFPVLFYLMLLAPRVVAGDRFYSPETAQSAGVGIAAALSILVVRCFLTWPGASIARRMVALGLEVLAAVIVVREGVRFTYVGAGHGAPVELGYWAPFATVCWILFNMYAFRLLDGLDGAVPVLLLTAATAVLVTTWGANEYFLAALSMVIIGAVLGSLRFHFFPARIPLRGPATAAFGLVFAVLTVLARQKTVAVLLLIFPLALILLLLGGTMLGLLERTLLLPERGKEEGSPLSTPGADQEKE